MENAIDLYPSGFQLEQIDPIHHKRLLAFVNYWISHMVNHLNDFATTSENKLFIISKRLVKLETAVTLLEAKLASIPGLQSLDSSRQIGSDSIKLQSAPPNANAVVLLGPTLVKETNVPLSSTAGVQPPPIATNSAVAASTETTVVTKQAEENSVAQHGPDSAQTVQKDPRYVKYFKMLQLGVPAMAVKQKMSVEGIDPKILDNPNQIVSDASQPSKARQNDISDDDFSDNDSVSSFSD